VAVTDPPSALDLPLPRRDSAVERATLERLAAWASQFTPRIHIEGEKGLLLEVEGSLARFGGATALMNRVREETAMLGFQVRCALAPTATGAWWLARAGAETAVTDFRALAARLAALPLSALPGAEAAALPGQLGECMGLPRAALAQRLSPDLIAALDRALGRVADWRPVWLPPARFAASLSLPVATTECVALACVAHRLVLELCGFLAGRGAGVDRLTVYLFHCLPLSTRFTLGLPAPSRDPAHLLALLRERLVRIALATPVYEVGLEADTPLPLPEYGLDQFGETVAEGGVPALVERLQTRLGEGAIDGLRALAGHYPAQSWRYCPAGTSGAPFPAGARPLWLLPVPVPLEQRNCRPWFSGPLSLRRTSPPPEASGLDSSPVARDYYLAEGPDGDRLWVYREQGGERRWFLYGVFE
jgi:protein ImuB